MAGKLATDLRQGDRIVVSLGAAAGDPAGGRRAFVGTFNHLGQPIDAKGDVLFGTPSLEIGGVTGGDPQPEFPNDEFQRLLREGGNKPTAATARLMAEYNTKVEAWEKKGNGAGGAVADRIRAAVLSYAEKHYDVKITAQAGQYASLDPAQVICRPSYREGDKVVTFTVAAAPVWGL